MFNGPSTIVQVTKINPQGQFDVTDELATEEPLEIRIESGEMGNRTVKNVSVTMRTPGNDKDLAIGFLFTEGIIRGKEEIADASSCFIACAENKENVIQVSLRDGVIPNLNNADRNFYTTSSCGVCGKGSINAIRTVSGNNKTTDNNYIGSDILLQLPVVLQQHQEVFESTGGLHASALFSSCGELLLLREDVGRHNALDKVIGAALMDNLLPIKHHVLLLSGRASFELVQKAVMAGINIIAAVGAPSTLAMQLAQEFNVTLIGFLRGSRFNIYTGRHRVLISSTIEIYEGKDKD